LSEQLCDLGLSEWSSEKTAAPRKRCVTDKPSQAQIIRKFFQKAENRCENCGSTFALEIDYIVPRAKSGLSNPENLRVPCRSCNQRSAIQELGIQKMDPFIN
jgi:5-methylcytosine-specific restriction endonuclease McrA